MAFGVVQVTQGRADGEVVAGLGDISLCWEGRASSGAGNPQAQPSPQIRELFQNNTCGNLSVCHLFLIVLFFSASQGLFSSLSPVTTGARSAQLLLY